jgi:hypothetical protein
VALFGSNFSSYVTVCADVFEILVSCTILTLEVQSEHRFFPNFFSVSTSVLLFDSVIVLQRCSQPSYNYGCRNNFIFGTVASAQLHWDILLPFLGKPLFTHVLYRETDRLCALVVRVPGC